MTYQDQDLAGEKAPPRIPLWGEVGATLARLGAPLETGFQDGFEPLDLELPLKGGQGRAPEATEAKRQAAALIRLLYDDVFAYQGDAAAEDLGAEPEVAVAAQPAAPQAPPVEVQAFDRKTGQPIKVRVNMLPNPASQPG